MMRDLSLQSIATINQVATPIPETTNSTNGYNIVERIEAPTTIMAEAVHFKYQSSGLRRRYLLSRLQ